MANIFHSYRFQLYFTSLRLISAWAALHSESIAVSNEIFLLIYSVLHSSAKMSPQLPLESFSMVSASRSYASCIWPNCLHCSWWGTAWVFGVSWTAIARVCNLKARWWSLFRNCTYSKVALIKRLNSLAVSMLASIHSINTLVAIAESFPRLSLSFPSRFPCLCAFSRRPILQQFYVAGNLPTTHYPLQTCCVNPTTDRANVAACLLPSPPAWVQPVHISQNH